MKKSFRRMVQKAKNAMEGAWLAPSTEHATPDLGAVSSSPTLRVEVTLRKLQ